MSDLCISCDSVVNGRRHTVLSDVCEHWQHQNKQYFFQWLSYLKQMKSFLSNYRGNEVEWVHKIL